MMLAPRPLRRSAQASPAETPGASCLPLTHTYIHIYIYMYTVLGHFENN